MDNSLPVPAHRMEKAALLRHPSFKILSEDKAERRIQAVEDGTQIMDSYPHLPKDRPTRDVGCALMFGITGCVLMGLTMLMVFTTGLDKRNDLAWHYESGDEVADAGFDRGRIPDIAKCVLVAMVVAVLTGISFVHLSVVATKLVVYVCLAVPAVLFIGLGLVLFSLIGDVPGMTAELPLGLLFVGTCWFPFLFCARKRIPFTIELCQCVAKITETHSSMYLISLFGAGLSFFWMWISTAGTYTLAFAFGPDTSASACAACVFGPFASLWGLMVFYNVTHTAFCGVFARWYFAAGTNAGSSNDVSNDVGSGGCVNEPLIQSSGGDRGTWRPSLKVALTSSFGSICYGSFVVTLCRIMAALSEQAMKDGDNLAVKCIGCIVKCILDCIGDVVEYLNEWAYVQCAIRGAGYCDAGRITWSLCTCANVRYIIADSFIGTVKASACLLVTAAGTLAGIIAVENCSQLANYYQEEQRAVVLISFLFSFAVGSVTTGIFNSGAKTILCCWAEDSSPLERSYPEIAQGFHDSLEAIGKRFDASD